MSRIDQIAQLVYEFLAIPPQITDNPNDIDRTIADISIIISPSKKVSNIEHLDSQFFDLWLLVIRDALAKTTLETYKNTLLKMRSNSTQGYRWSKRVTLTITLETGFAVGDTVHDADSSGTGVIANISGTAITLKDCTGAWVNGDTFTNDVATTTTTSNETITYYPIAVYVNITESGSNGYQLQLEGRWEI